MIRNREKTILFIIFLFTTSLRLAYITQKNLWFDEIYSWHFSQESFMTIIFATWGDIHPPLFSFLLKLWIFLFGDSVFSLRLLPSLSSSVAIFFIYPISKKVLNEYFSFIVLILYAISPLNLFYSQEVRMASINLLFNVASTFYLIKLIEEPLIKIKSKNSILFILFSILSIYTHYFSFFILLAQFIYLIYLKLDRKANIIKFRKIYSIIFVCYLIWLPVMFIQISRGQPWRYSQTLSGVLYQLRLFVIDLGLGFYQRYLSGSEVDLFFYTLILLIVISIIGNYLINRKIKKGQSERIILIVLITFIPLLFSILISFKQWIEFFRYLSIIIPFLLILIVFGFSYYNSYLKIGLIFIFLIINIYGLDLYYKNNSKNNDYRPIMEMIKKSNDNSDKIFVYPFYYGWILDYYKKKGDYPNLNIVNYGWEFNSIIDSIKILPPNHSQFWFILDYHSFDTNTYRDKLTELDHVAIKSNENIFFIQPEKVKLFKFTN